MEEDGVRRGGREGNGGGSRDKREGKVQGNIGEEEEIWGRGKRWGKGDVGREVWRDREREVKEKAPRPQDKAPGRAFGTSTLQEVVSFTSAHSLAGLPLFEGFCQTLNSAACHCV
jgi:hypothetical protein